MLNVYDINDINDLDEPIYVDLQFVGTKALREELMHREAQKVRDAGIDLFDSIDLFNHFD